MPASAQRMIHLAHGAPGRLRLRLPWLRSSRDEALALADHVASLAGVLHAEVRMRTGSLVCLYDDERLSESRLISAVRRHTRVMRVVQPDEAPPADAEEHPSVRRGRVASAIEEGLRSANADLLRATDDRLDLGALGALGFLLAGAAEIVTTRQIPAPPWFNLAWWAFRTFTLFPRGDDGSPAAPSRRGGRTPKRAPRAAAAKPGLAGRAKRRPSP